MAIVATDMLIALPRCQCMIAKTGATVMMMCHEQAFAAGSLSSGAKPVLNIEARWHGEGFFDQTEESAKFRQVHQ